MYRNMPRKRISFQFFHYLPTVFYRQLYIKQDAYRFVLLCQQNSFISPYRNQPLIPFIMCEIKQGFCKSSIIFNNENDFIVLFQNGPVVGKVFRYLVNFKTFWSQIFFKRRNNSSFCFLADRHFYRLFRILFQRGRLFIFRDINGEFTSLAWLTAYFDFAPQ